MKILLTGKNGQVGFELQRALAPLGTLVAVGSKDCDFADATALRSLVQHIQPQLIVNPAAFTAVDKAEAEVHQARAVNTIAPGILGEEAAAIGATVIHYSTDYVFDGTKDTPYAEADEANPQSVYGQTKLDGEKALIAATANHIILRTSWVAGVWGNNFAKTILRLASERDELKVVSDQFGAPTSAAFVADATAHLVRQLQRREKQAFPFGLYHLTASGEASWHAYAQYIVGEAIKMGKSLQTTQDRICPIPAKAFPTPAKRPKNSRLDTSLFRDTFDLTTPHWEAGIRHILQQII